jgi:hypothetical protein
MAGGGRRVRECCRRMHRPCLCRGGEEGARGATTSMGTAWPELVDMITSRQVLSSFYVSGRSGIMENRAQTNRAIGNGESESFDASRFGLTRSWTGLDSVASPARPSARCTVPLRFHYPHGFSPFVQFVPFVCPAGVARNCQKDFHRCVTMTFEQKNTGRT